MSRPADLSHDRAQELEAENRLLRQLLWVWHGCIAQGEGELCCAGHDEGHRLIDFKHDSAQRIQTLLQEPSLRYVHEHQDDVCRHCGVTRWSWDASKPCRQPAHEWVTP